MLVSSHWDGGQGEGGVGDSRDFSIGHQEIKTRKLIKCRGHFSIGDWRVCEKKNFAHPSL